MITKQLFLIVYLLSVVLTTADTYKPHYPLSLVATLSCEYPGTIVILSIKNELNTHNYTLKKSFGSYILSIENKAATVLAIGPHLSKQQKALQDEETEINELIKKFKEQENSLDDRTKQLQNMVNFWKELIAVERRRGVQISKLSSNSLELTLRSVNEIEIDENTVVEISDTQIGDELVDFFGEIIINGWRYVGPFTALIRKGTLVRLLGVEDYPIHTEKEIEVFTSTFMVDEFNKIIDEQ